MIDNSTWAICKFIDLSMLRLTTQNSRIRWIMLSAIHNIENHVIWHWLLNYRINIVFADESEIVITAACYVLVCSISFQHFAIFYCVFILTSLRHLIINLICLFLISNTWQITSFHSANDSGRLEYLFICSYLRASLRRYARLPVRKDLACSHHRVLGLMINSLTHKLPCTLRRMLSVTIISQGLLYEWIGILIP